MELFNQLLAEIERIPAIDVHSRVPMESPAAVDAAGILLSADLRTELRASGAPAALLEMEDTRRQVLEIAPSFEQLRNTTTYWRLQQILHDLYEVDAHPHESGADEVWDRVKRTAADSQWPATVLGRAKVARILCACDWSRRVPPASGAFAPILRLDSLVNEPFSSKSLDRLGELTNQSIYEAGDLRKAVGQLIANAAEAGAVGVCAAFDPPVDFEEGSRDAADRILSLVLLGQKIDRADRKALRSYVMDLVLEACAEHSVPFQLMLGMQRPPREGPSLSAFEPGAAAMYSGLFARHPHTRFDVAVGSETLAHQFTVAARACPNVCVSGCWWSLMFPTHMRKTLRERIEMLPATRVNALWSAAGCVEWVYATSKLVRRELAFVLARMVSEGYLSEATAVSTAQSYLHDNPALMYKSS